MLLSAFLLNCKFPVSYYFTFTFRKMTVLQIISKPNLHSFVVRLVLLLFCSFVLTLQGCEINVPLSDVDLPNNEKIMVNAAVIAGQPLRNVQITRSISPSDTFSLAKINISDADVRIVVDGREVRLRLQGAVDSVRLPTSGRLIPGPTSYEAPELIPQAGRTYSLTVRWKGLTAQAQTFVPEPPRAEVIPQLVWRKTPVLRQSGPGNFRFYDTNLVAFPVIPIITKPQELYTMRQQTLTDTATQVRYVSPNFFQPQLPRIADDGKQSVQAGFQLQTDLMGRILISDFDFQSQRPRMILFSPQTTTITVELEARDVVIKPFLETSSRLFEGVQFNPLGNIGRNPHWNVKGDGIGLFIGQSTTSTVTLRP